jgi:hypothetical protein
MYFFLDLEKAFDCIPRTRLWMTLREFNVSPKLLGAITSTYDTSLAGVIGTNDMFEVSTGVRQGSVLSPLLFILYMDKLLVRMRDCKNGRSKCLAYGDDVGQTADTIEGLQILLNCWDELLQAEGMKMSYKKTKYMAINRNPIVNLNEMKISLNNVEIEKVHSFKYLGSTISDNCKIEDEINH